MKNFARILLLCFCLMAPFNMGFSAVQTPQKPAVEKTGNYNKFTHGEAVIEGVRFVFDLALKKNVIDKNYKFFAEDLIKKFNFKKLPEYKLTNMIKIMKSDKKANKNNLIFVLPVNYSEAEFFELSPEELTDLSERK